MTQGQIKGLLKSKGMGTQLRSINGTLASHMIEKGKTRFQNKTGNTRHDTNISVLLKMKIQDEDEPTRDKKKFDISNQMRTPNEKKIPTVGI